MAVSGAAAAAGVVVDGRGLPAAVVPAVTAPYRVLPAPRPLAAPPTVSLDDGWPVAVRRRLERLAADRAGVLVRARDADATGLEAAVRAAWALLPAEPGDASTCPTRPGTAVVAHLGLRVDLDTSTASPDGDSRCPQATALLLELAGPALLLLGWLLACADDLVVLRRTGEGTLSAELLAVAFPSGWAPRRLAGACLTELHAPVAGNARLQRAAPALTEALLTKGPLRQHVWGLEPSGRLDDDPSAPDVSTAPGPADPAQWWLRVEEQTSIPLPHLSRALFVIRPHLRPLQSLSRGQRLALAEAIAGMDSASRAYKGITGVADDMVRWLRS